MTSSELRQRAPLNPVPDAPSTDPKLAAATSPPRDTLFHPSGKANKSGFIAFVRAATFFVYFTLCCIVIHLTQLVGSPLYFLNRELYYAYMSLCKANFGLLTTTMTQWWAPTTIRMSGDDSVAGQLARLPDGRVQCDFPERLVMIANHQIYTDWLYLWWVGYTNRTPMHGHIYIILKESLKWIPVIGPGCMFHGFIFMSRKMAIDQPRLAHRLGKLKQQFASAGRKYMNPMWLLLFPEGTNLSNNGRRKSAVWAEKSGQTDMRHVLLPRSTGMFFCLNQLKGSVDYVYDATVAYEGIPRGKFGEDYFSLSSTYFHGRPPKSVNFHWRRFALADIPLDDSTKFDEWLRERWHEKDALMEEYLTTGHFPAAGKDGHIETEVRTQHWWEFTKIFVMLGGFGLIFNMVLKTVRLLRIVSAQ